MDFTLLASGVSNLCANTHTVLALVGWVLTIFKVAIPVIIIVLGLIDLGKAAVSSKPEEIKKTVTSLVWRLVGGIAIFFIPLLVMTIFGWISGWSSATSALGTSKYVDGNGVTQDVRDWDVCSSCITSPWSAKCANAKGQYDDLAQ